ncbi:uncharacterized protein LOC135834540 isoform X2 [Planococcus citri]|uniref:uncharacterized protein LOC135834540 isoform X2 n=1 Tax=Planococcus citri TaxID=170843 RepID=UPI0031F9F159
MKLFDTEITHPYVVVHDEGAFLGTEFLTGGICIIHRDWINFETTTMSYPYGENRIETQAFREKAVTEPFLPSVPLTGNNLKLFKSLTWINSKICKYYGQYGKYRSALKKVSELENESSASLLNNYAIAHNEKSATITSSEEPHEDIQSDVVIQPHEDNTPPKVIDLQNMALPCATKKLPSEETHIIIKTIKNVEAKVTDQYVKLRRTCTARFLKLEQAIATLNDGRTPTKETPTAAVITSPVKISPCKAVRQKSVLNLPLVSVEDWTNFDQKLKSNKLFNTTFRKYLNSFGNFGKRKHDLKKSPFVASIFDSISSKTDACKVVNFSGSNQKFNLKTSTMYEMMYKYTENRYENGFPQAVFESRVKSWIHAGHEKNSLLARKNEENVTTTSSPSSTSVSAIDSVSTSSVIVCTSSVSTAPISTPSISTPSISTPSASPSSKTGSESS